MGKSQVIKEWEITFIDFTLFKPTHFYCNKVKPENKRELTVCPKCGKTGQKSFDGFTVVHQMKSRTCMGRSSWELTSTCELFSQEEVVAQIQDLRSMRMSSELGIKIKRSEHNPRHISEALRTRQILETDLVD